MKVSIFVLNVLCLSLLVQMQKPKNEAREINNPASFLTAGDFVSGMPEKERVAYTVGLMDGFYASGLLGANNEAVSSLASCTHGMDSGQLSAVFTRYIKNHPEKWHFPLSVSAFEALSHACPGILRVQ